MRRATALILIALALAASAATAGTRLVVVGGGDRARDAMARFVGWSGGAQARVLVVTWASSVPQESYAGMLEDLLPHQPAQVEAAPEPPLTPTTRAEVLAQLARASGVFFGGGDQAKVMDVFRDSELMAAFRARYAAGIPFGGTSAGTAIMSKIMLTGEGDFTVIDADKVETRDGLGLLPGVILDQHFIKRSRENRLFGLVLRHSDQLGVGINEDAALLVSDDRHAEVAGGPVMLVDGRERAGALVVRLLKPGDRYDLVRRRRE